MKNHEIWHTCSQCGEEYDEREHWFHCPHCGHNEESVKQ